MDYRLLICKNPKVLEHLKNGEIRLSFIAKMVENNRPMLPGDVFTARDSLSEAGFKWGTDFYIRRCNKE